MIIKNTLIPNTENKSFGSLISAAKYDYQLVIPNSFQREYSWKRSQIETLIDDLKETFSDQTNKCYLGKIILSDVSMKEKNIVDGQQRLTTLFLILHSLVIKTNNKYNISRIHYGNSELNNQGLILKYSLDSYNKNLLNLKSGQANPLEIGYSEIEQLLFDESSDYFIDQSEYENYISSLLNQVYLEVQTIPSEYQEEYFIDINNKGVKLDSIDILKSELRNIVTDNDLFDSKWETIINIINKIPMNLFSRSQNKTKLDVIITWYLKINNTSINKLFNTLDEKNVIIILNDLIELLKFTTNVVLPNGKFYKQTCVLRYFSGYSFIPHAWKLTNTHSHSEVFNLITLMAISNKNGEKWNQSLSKLNNDFNYSKNALSSEFSIISYRNSKLVKGILSIVEASLLSKINNTLFEDEFENLMFRWKNQPPRLKLSIEHIQSQSSNEEFVNSLGNLTLLTVSENSEVQDSNKFQTYLNTSFLLTNLLCDGKKHDLEFKHNILECTSFNESNITNFSKYDCENRLNYLVDLVYNQFSK